jgi:hypothetical protein
MHPARFSYLAYNNAPRRKIASKARSDDGSWALTLECGHAGSCVAHMNPNEDWRCVPCGEQYVKSAPKYTEEFSQ